MENANTSAGLDSTSGVLDAPMSSGASGPSSAAEVADAVKVGFRFMGASPYPVKRARPDSSTPTLLWNVDEKSVIET